MDIDGQTQNESGRISSIADICHLLRNHWLNPFWMLALKDVLIFPIVCNSSDYKPSIGLIRKCIDPGSTFSKSSSYSSHLLFLEQPKWIEKGNFQYNFAPSPLLAKFSFWLIMQSSQGVIMQFSYLKHLFTRHFASLPCVNQLFFRSPQLSTALVNSSAAQVNQLAL